MPFSYSVAYGLIAGLFTYAVLNSMIYITKLVTRGKIQPPDADLAEYWTYKPGGNPPWFIKAAQGKLWRRGRFSDMDAHSVGEGTEASEKELVEGTAMRVRTQETS
jgi:AGZA family xanthine/uracil permease-like MFS transporter